MSSLSLVFWEKMVLDGKGVLGKWDAIVRAGKVPEWRVSSGSTLEGWEVEGVGGFFPGQVGLLPGSQGGSHWLVPQGGQDWAAAWVSLLAFEESLLILTSMDWVPRTKAATKPFVTKAYLPLWKETWNSPVHRLFGR